MDQKFYTDERNVQIVIAILKANGIRKVIASPGTTNVTFVGSIQQDPFFEIYSSVDERSAAYIACGLAAESGEPVVLTCTGATASRNYYSGLTEAYYRKLPVLAITSHQGTDRIGHLIAQNIDRRIQPNDIVKKSVDIPIVHDSRDERFAEIEANKAVLELFKRGGGPVHINLHTRYSRDFSVKELPPCRIIRNHNSCENLPDLPSGKIAIFIGAHRTFNFIQNQAIEAFCSAHDVVVFCDHSSGYYGKYRVLAPVLFTQRDYECPLNDLSLLIHIGEVSGDYTSGRIKSKEVWRVSEDGEIRDTFNKLTHVFEMPEELFFKAYTNSGVIQNKNDLAIAFHKEVDKVRASISNINFSNIWIAQQTAQRIPSGSRVHLGILNTLRSWNFFEFPDKVESSCNVGGFGIDGTLSSLIGASLADTKRLYFGVLGDLAFFYDMNVVANRHVGKNVRILLINNGKGTEFKMYNHPCSAFGDNADNYMAAAGHFGNKSPKLVQHYAEDLGYEYLTASNKEEYLVVLERFVTPDITDRPMILEVFTDSTEESDMLKKINYTISSPKKAVKREVTNFVKNVIGVEGSKIIKKIIK
jgi:2-succinyl-5-enolpyruvyl-6-hydroxy-3-cyclohexene-1-carboxylate synthase